MQKFPKRTAAALVATALVVCMVLLPACGSEEPVKAPPSNLPVIPTSGLLAYYPFDGDVLDASGNDNHATLLGTASVTTFLTIGSNNDDRVTLPYTILEGVGDFTISVWGRITVIHTTGDNTLFSAARGGADNIVLLLFHPSTDNWMFGVNMGGDNFGPSATIRDSGWHHIAVLRNGSIGRFYFDGNEIGDGMAVSDVAIDVNPGGVLLGQDQDSVGGGFSANQSWAGDLDNLRIYNRALTAAEINALSRETGWGD